MGAKNIGNAMRPARCIVPRKSAAMSALRSWGSAATWALALAAVFGDASAAVGTDAYVAGEALCKRPTPIQMAWLVAPAWSRFAEFIRVCKVSRAKDAKPAVLLFSVWADELYAKEPAGAETVAMPRPVLFSPAGRKLGELPANFPSDPPSELLIAFREWRHGMPQEIALCIRTPTASGDQALPSLRYSASIRQYRQLAAFPSKRPGDCHAG